MFADIFCFIKAVIGARLSTGHFGLEAAIGYKLLDLITLNGRFADKAEIA